MPHYTTARVSGHTLCAEGMAFRSAVGDLSGSRVGVGLCSCGATSSKLDSNRLRKQWHREHKAEVRAARFAKAEES